MSDLSFKDLCYEWTKILARRTPMPGHLKLSGCEHVEILSKFFRDGRFYEVRVYKIMGRRKGLVPFERG